MNKHNIEIDKDLIIGSNFGEIEAGKKTAKQLFALNKDVTAIFAANDLIAIGIMQFCKENSIRIPDNVALVGFDNIKMSSMLEVPLSSVAIPYKRIASTVVNRMLEKIKNNKKAGCKNILLPCEFIVRKSTGIARRLQ